MEWLTISEYMKKFNVSRKAVEQMASEGHLLVANVGNRKYVKVQTDEVSSELKEIKSNLEKLMKHFGLPPSEQRGA